MKESVEEPSADADSVEPSSDGVTVPEAFQKQVHQLVKGAKKPHLQHMRDRISQREDEIRNQEMKGKKPEMYSTAEMPAS